MVQRDYSSFCRNIRFTKIALRALHHSGPFSSSTVSSISPSRNESLTVAYVWGEDRPQPCLMVDHGVCESVTDFHVRRYRSRGE